MTKPKIIDVPVCDIDLVELLGNKSLQQAQESIGELAKTYPGRDVYLRAEYVGYSGQSMTLHERRLENEAELRARVAYESKTAAARAAKKAKQEAKERQLLASLQAKYAS